MLSTDTPTRAVGPTALAGLSVVVVAFMVLSLLVTATGTSRFAVAMGYDGNVGYAVGALLDLGKGILLVAVIALWSRRSLGLAAVFGMAWCSLVTFSWLATHATVSTAIATIERSGTWKMEVRSNTKAELASLEQQLAALSRPSPPRPAKVVREALAAEHVPASIWQNSQECKSIQESAHFAKACAQVAQLRRELAAAQEYERLSARTRELRVRLAEDPIVATSDPLPAAFSATLGRLLPLGGVEGVALLLTMVVELMSCFGLAGLSALYRGRDERDPGITGGHSLAPTVPDSLEPAGGTPPATRQSPSLRTLPKPSPTPVASGRASSRELGSREASRSSSNDLPVRPAYPSTLPQGASPMIPEIEIGSHVAAFVRQCLQTSNGSSLAAAELRAAYEAWCVTHDHKPLSQPKFAAELKTLGYNKWKSDGRMRYRDLQLAAQWKSSVLDPVASHPPIVRLFAILVGQDLP